MLRARFSIKETEKWSVYWYFESGGIRLETQWFGIEGMRRAERTIFTITIVLERGSCLGGVLRGRALVGRGSMWWGFLP